MDNRLSSEIRRGNAVLVLGAGASLSSIGGDGNNLPTGNQLAKDLLDLADLEYSNEPLRIAYAAAREVVGSVGIDRYLRDRFTNCKPDVALETLALYTWPRIYTLNIDDSLETALRNRSKQNVLIRNYVDPIEDRDQLFATLQLIKLNGDSSRIEQDGVIFSVEEYASEHFRERSWYEEIANDFFRFTFIFVGSNLDEELLFHHIERLKSLYQNTEKTSYLITPSISAANKIALGAYKIRHFASTFEEFSEWLKSEIPAQTPEETLASARPAFRFLEQQVRSAPDRNAALSLFDNVDVINRGSVALLAAELKTGIRDFYKGFKPDWRDLLDGVPAELEFLDKAVSTTQSCLEEKVNLVAFYGPAGCGKTTLLMQLANEFALKRDYISYYLSAETSKLNQIIGILENAHDDRFLVFIDRAEGVLGDLIKIASSRENRKVLIIVAERQNIWEQKCGALTQLDGCKAIRIPNITESDAPRDSG